jgi:hypothetical protein
MKMKKIMSVVKSKLFLMILASCAFGLTIGFLINMAAHELVNLLQLMNQQTAEQVVEITKAKTGLIKLDI